MRTGETDPADGTARPDGISENGASPGATQMAFADSVARVAEQFRPQQERSCHEGPS